MKAPRTQDVPQGGGTEDSWGPGPSSVYSRTGPQMPQVTMLSAMIPRDPKMAQWPPPTGPKSPQLRAIANHTVEATTMIVATRSTRPDGMPAGTYHASHGW